MKTESFIEPERSGAIIAMKGLPCTGKTLVAQQICNWAKLPVLYIDDFIGAVDNNNIADDSWEEAERLQVSVLEQAFTTLYRVAHSQLNTAFRCGVIKSRLSSTFELEQLFQLLLPSGYRWQRRTLLIVECQVRNKHQWQNRFNDDDYEKKWYRPRSWNDIEKAIYDYYDPQALADWDLHLLHLIQHTHWPPLVRRLVVDPHYDLDIQAVARTLPDINPIFAHAINHLLSASHAELNFQNPYRVEFDEFRRSLAKEVLNALTSSTRSKDLCGVHGCLFKYREELRVDEDDDEGSCCCCGVCDQKVVSGQPGYTCHYCIFTLHKSCAEMIRFDSRSITIEYSYLYRYIRELPANKKHACNSHLQEFREYCDSCRFQTVLKGRMLPAVVNRDHLPHPLSLRILYKDFICKACGVDEYSSSYVCRICEWYYDYYHIQCIFMPGELKHEHGGHEHVLKLKYSQDDMEQEDYWCDICFKDLDPYIWFYSCQSCPYYAAHLYCARVYPRQLWQRRSI